MSRRQWEKRLLSQFKTVEREYQRLVREIARNRNEISQVKSGLAETGRVAARAGLGRRTRGGVEDRMVSDIAKQLTEIGTAARPQEVPEVKVKSIDDLELDVTQSLDTDSGQDDGLLSFPALEDNTPDQGDAAIVDLIEKAVDQDRIDVFIQPIVNLPQRKLRFYELLSRLRTDDGDYMAANKYIQLALKNDLLPALDNLMLLRALQMVRGLTPTGAKNMRGYFCNISALTLSDAKFMADLVEFVSQERDLAPRLIFELSQKDMTDPSVMTPEVLKILDGLAELGCRFSMDHTNNLNLNFDALGMRYVRYVKVDAPRLLEEMDEQGGFNHMRRFKDDCDRNGLDLIVSRIEGDRELVELLDLDIDYGQGFLFGEPELPNTA